MLGVPSTRTVIYWVTLLVCASCSKHKRITTENIPVQPPVDLTGSIAQLPSPAGQPTPWKSSDEEPSPADLERNYAATADVDDRIDIVYALAGDGSPEALNVLGRLFRNEKDTQLKAEILTCVDSFDEPVNTKLFILSTAISAGQPEEVREAAIDALESVVDRRAIPIWRTLLNDKDFEIRDAAKEQIEDLQAIENQ